MPLSGGSAVLAVLFKTAGMQSARAHLATTPEITGDSLPLIVNDVFFAIERPEEVRQATAGSYLLTVRDGDGALAPDYRGTVTIATSDGNARLGDGKTIEHTFSRVDGGQLALDIAFSKDGDQSVSVSDGTPWRTATLDLAVATDESIVRIGDGSDLEGAGPSFSVTASASQINAGVPITITATALDSMGQTDTGYTGTVKLSSTDSAFAPGTTFEYTFTTGDAGVHTFNVTFNTAGASQTITVYDKNTPTMTGDSPAVQVDETYLHVSFASGTVVQNTAINMTVEAKDGSNNLVTGYRGTVGLASSWDSVKATQWGTGVTGFTPPKYTFTAGDAGSHTFTPKFQYAGDQTATITDQALSSRTVTSSALTVTHTPANQANRVAVYYTHWASPDSVQLDSRVTIRASLASRGRLIVRRNLGTLREPIWLPGEVVQDEAWDYLGADSPSFALMPDDTIALFYSYTDGTYYQVWMTTSSDDGESWSTPVQVTTESGHVGRIQTVVDGSTLYLFWSQRDTDRVLSYQTTTDLSTWSSVQTVNQQIGVPVGKTTTNFDITKLSSGDWVLGWLWTSAVNEVGGVANNLGYPTVHVATSSDLSTWSNETELNLPYSQRWPESVALAQHPSFDDVYAVYEHLDTPWDTYIYARVSEDDGLTWNSEVLVGADLSATANGSQGYTAKLPSLTFIDHPFESYLSCSMAAFAIGSGSGTVKGEYGWVAGGDPDTANAVMACNLDAVAPLRATVEQSELFQVPLKPPPQPDNPTPDPPGELLPPDIDCPTNACAVQGYPVNAMTGYQWINATDFFLPGRGMNGVVTRTYQGFDAYAGLRTAFGIGWNWTYGSRATTTGYEGAVTIIDGDGKRLHFTYDDVADEYTPFPHVFASLDHDTVNSEYLLTRHDQTVWAYDSSFGWLKSITDRNGNETTLVYDDDLPFSELDRIVLPGGRELTITTDSNLRITRIDAPESLFTTYTYDANGHLLTATDAAGSTTTYTYNSQHLMLTVVDGNNHTVESNTYGSLGRVIEQEDADEQVMTFTFDSLKVDGIAGPHKFTDRRGNETWYYNDKRLRMTKRIIKEGVSTILTEEWTYDADDNVTSYEDGNGVLTTYSYDGNGNRLTKVRDDGPFTWNLELTTAHTYNSTNDLLTVTDPLNHTTTLTYDGSGNLTSIENHLNEEITFDYDASGQLIEMIDPETRTVTYDYSTEGDLVEVVVPGNATTTFGYDDAGRLTSVEDANSYTTTLAYNGRGQTTSITNELSQTTSFTYDTVGNLTVVTDALIRTTEYDYDELNRLILVTDAINGETEYAYDANGNLTSLTDAEDHTTTYTYDGANRAVTMTDPLSEVWEYSYDDNHNLTLVEQPNGKDVSYEFDAANRLTGVDLLDDSSLDIEFDYDAASRRTSMEDDTGTTTYTYDDADRLTSVAAPTTGTVSYGYNDAGQRTSITYPSTHQVTYGYNSRGELETVTDWLSGVTTYTYDPAGRLTEIEYPNNVVGEFGYDDADRLTDIEYLDGMTSLEAISYVVNAMGIRTSMTDGSGTTDYTYDALYRLTEVEYPNSDTTDYTYDAVGNRTSLTINGGTPISNTYNDANALTASGSDSYSYDENGNLISKTVSSVTTDYTWDALNRLLELDDGTTTAEYDYNGDGLRVAATVNSSTTDFTWDPMGLGTILDDGDEYARGLGLISRITSGGTPTYVHADGLGSVRLLTDNTATVVGTETYDVFGASRSQTGTQVPFTFTGEQVDNESGLVYLRARYMDPESGRFINRDPIGFAGGDVNLYTYVRNNPAELTDPSGLWPDVDVGNPLDWPGDAYDYVVDNADSIVIALDSFALATSVVQTAIFVGCVAAIVATGGGAVPACTVLAGISLVADVLGDLAGVASAIVACLNAFDKWCGELFEDCLVAIANAVLGFLTPPLIGGPADIVIDAYSLCRDFGHCDPTLTWPNPW